MSTILSILIVLAWIIGAALAWIVLFGIFAIILFAWVVRTTTDRRAP